MKERPILFSAPMVRAIFNGTKTQTRRVVTQQHLRQIDLSKTPCSANWSKPMPYGQQGDRLWVRETWAYGIHALSSRNAEREGPWVYGADTAAEQGRLCDRWRPSIHMRREASRITLEITGVRVERMQDISEADALAEGVSYDPGEGGVFHVPDFGGCASDSAVDSYRKLWESINGPGSWDANPWVWVVEFKRMEGCAA